MLRLCIGILLILSLTVFLPGCGDESSGLSGSQCKNIDCNYDTLECQLYEPPYHALKLFYLQTDAGRIYTAIINIDLEGISPVEGAKIEGQDFLDRVTITRTDGGWPDFRGNFCEIKKGGDQADQKLEGTCAFDFFGYYLTANFSCTLKLAAIE
jgi:hypothetical protein